MNIGLDIGYSAVKAISEGRKVSFPSVVGTPERARIDLREIERSICLTHPSNVLVGEEAIVHSRFLQRREDRAWIESGEYYLLFLAALTELDAGTLSNIRIVTGLPVNFYSDSAKLQDRIVGEHKVRREGKAFQTFVVSECRVIPQPFGTLLGVSLDDWGKIADTDLANGMIGVIDIGGKSTNILAVEQLAEISRKTASVNVGGWDVIRVVKAQILERYPELDLRDHQVVEAVSKRELKYFGRFEKVGGMVEEALTPLTEQIIAQATQLWNGGANMDTVLITGGGALLLGERLQSYFRHAKVVADPIFANAVGYWKFGQRSGAPA
jgi:plasmid segregation protein ParM